MVATPTKLTEKQRNILKEFAELSGEDTSSLGKNIFQRVKDAMAANKRSARQAGGLI